MYVKLFHYPNGGFGKNVLIFRVDISSSVHVGNKEKYILIIYKGPTQGLGNITLTAEAEHSINQLKNSINSKQMILN